MSHEMQVIGSGIPFYRNRAGEDLDSIGIAVRHKSRSKLLGNNECDTRKADNMAIVSDRGPGIPVRHGCPSWIILFFTTFCPIIFGARPVYSHRFVES